MNMKKYKTAKAFRAALETRLKQISKEENTDLQRLRRQIVFDRLLARIFYGGMSYWVLKGGYAMELRMQEARTTKDIDLTLENPQHLSDNSESLNERLRERLQEQTSNDLGDYFIFLIGESIMDIDATPYGGARFPVDARLDGRTFVKFHLDIGVGDVVLNPLESINGRDWLGFAGIEPPKILMLSKEQQFSEKLHAYTLPRENPNSRVKDLVDMTLLLLEGNLNREMVVSAMKATFAKRKTHDLPEKLIPPPKEWDPVFQRLSFICKLDKNIEDAYKVLAEFIDELAITE